jgi:hypothetical protein
MPMVSVIFRIASPYTADQIQWIEGHQGVISVKTINERELAMEMRDEDPIPSLIEHFVKLGVQIRAVEPRMASLEDIYMHLQQDSRKEKK